MGHYSNNPFGDKVRIVGEGQRYRTIAQALTGSVIGTTIYVLPGEHDLGSDGLTLPYGRHLIGTGYWRDTIIKSSHLLGTIRNYGGALRIENLWLQNTATDSTEGGTTNSAPALAMWTPPAWQAATSYAVGEVITNTVTASTSYVCVEAGLSGGTEPAWNTSLGATTTDGGVLWVATSNATPWDISVMNCAFASKGTAVYSNCGDRHMIRDCRWIGHPNTNNQAWGCWGIKVATGHLLSTETPPHYGVVLSNCIAENHLTRSAVASGDPVGFLLALDRTTVVDNTQVAMSAINNLAYGGATAGIVTGFYAKSASGLETSIRNSKMYAIGGNNEVAGAYTGSQTSASHVLLLDNLDVQGTSSHANGVLQFHDAKTVSAGATWTVRGGTATLSNYITGYRSTVVNGLRSNGTKLGTVDWLYPYKSQAVYIGVTAGAYQIGTTNLLYAGTTAQQITNTDDTYYVYLDNNGGAARLNVVTDAVGWPADTATYIPIAEVTVAGSVITAVTDVRGRVLFRAQ